ncbi:MAG: cation:proton antiporter [Anaerolineaceae bacterium]|nr:cation:proton antiporter [Anaerolineaceae bacterium]
MTLTMLAMHIVLPVLSVAIVLAVIRLVRGPKMPDRVVALDLMVTLGIGVIAVYAIATQQAVFLDVATVLALISFLGTTAFAAYLQRRPEV